jgi:MFS family permease
MPSRRRAADHQVIAAPGDAFRAAPSVPASCRRSGPSSPSLSSRGLAGQLRPALLLHGAGRSWIRSNRAFRYLWAARLLSSFGDSIGLIALLLYAADSFSNALAVTLLMLVGDFAPSLFSPFAGTFSDRWDPCRVMVICELVQAVVIAVIALTLPPLPVLLGLVAMRAAAAMVFQPASRSAVPGLVADSDLERANSAIGLGTNGLDAFGPLAGAALLPFLRISGLLLLDSATFIVSALLLLRLPALPRVPQAPGAGSSPLAGAREGMAHIWQNRVIRMIVIGFCAVVMFNAVDDVALVFLAKRTLHSGNSAASLLYAGAGLGLLAGFILLTRVAPSAATAVTLLTGYTVSSLGNLLTGLSFAVVAAFGFQILRGAGLSAMDVGHTTLIQRSVPSHLLARVFGNVYGAVGIAAGLSYVLGGLLLDATDPRITFMIAGVGGLLAAALMAIFLPRALRNAAGQSGSSASAQ